MDVYANVRFGSKADISIANRARLAERPLSARSGRSERHSPPITRRDVLRV